MPTDTTDLLDISTDDFIALVEDSLRYRPDPELLAARDAEELRKQDLLARLQSPELIERYYYALVAISKRVESTLGSRRAQVRRDRQRILDEEGEAGWRQAEQVYGSFRSSTLRFKGGLDRALVEAKRLLLQTEDSLGHRVHGLEAAIRQHRTDMEALNEDPSPYDRELWSVLDG